MLMVNQKEPVYNVAIARECSSINGTKRSICAMKLILSGGWPDKYLNIVMNVAKPLKHWMAFWNIELWHMCHQVIAYWSVNCVPFILMNQCNFSNMLVVFTIKLMNMKNTYVKAKPASSKLMTEKLIGTIKRCINAVMMMSFVTFVTMSYLSLKSRLTKKRITMFLVDFTCVCFVIMMLG